MKRIIGMALAVSLSGTVWAQARVDSTVIFQEDAKGFIYAFRVVGEATACKLRPQEWQTLIMKRIIKNVAVKATNFWGTSDHTLTQFGMTEVSIVGEKMEDALEAGLKATPYDCNQLLKSGALQVLDSGIGWGK